MRLPTRRKRQRRTLINSPLARWPFATVAACALLTGLYFIAVPFALISLAAWTPLPRTTPRTR